MIIILFLFYVVPVAISEPEVLEFYHEFAKVSYSNADVIDAKGVFFKINRTQGAMNLTLNFKRTFNSIPVSKHSFNKWYR